MNSNDSGCKISDEETGKNAGGVNLVCSVGARDNMPDGSVEIGTYVTIHPMCSVETGLIVGEIAQTRDEEAKELNAKEKHQHEIGIAPEEVDLSEQKVEAIQGVLDLRSVEQGVYVVRNRLLDFTRNNGYSNPLMIHEERYPVIAESSTWFRVGDVPKVGETH